MGASVLLQLGRGIIFALWGIVLAEIIWKAVDLYKKETAARSKEARRPKTPDVAAFEARVARAGSTEARARAQAELDRAYVKAEQAQRSMMERLLRLVDEAEEWASLMEKMARIDWAAWILRLFLLLLPIVFYTMIFSPCFSCFDFQAAATHEIGHVRPPSRLEPPTRRGLQALRTNDPARVRL